MPTPTHPESAHPAISSLVARRAVCSYLSSALHNQLEDRVLDQARSALMQGLLEQEAANLNFAGPVSHVSVKRSLIPVMHAFGTEFSVRVIDERPVLISYVLRNEQPVPVQIRTVNDLGRLLSVQARCAVPADVQGVSQNGMQNGLPRLVSVTGLSDAFHAVAWATEETSGCVVVVVDADGLCALKAELQHWMTAEQHATPEHLLAPVVYHQAA